MSAKHVIHTVGPIWHGGKQNEPETLRSAYLNSLKLAVDAGDKTVSFPSISTGAYGYPVEQAAKVALDAIREFCENSTDLAEVRMVLFDRGTLDAYQRALDQLP